MQSGEQKQAIHGFLTLLSGDGEVPVLSGRTTGRLCLTWEAHVTQSPGQYAGCHRAAGTLIIQHRTRSFEHSRESQALNAVQELKQTLGRLRRASSELHRTLCGLPVQYWVTYESGHASDPLVCITEDEELVWLNQIPD